ncbi:MAG: UDP-3-O-(3-hydroxymyristoyl)glucosamine N-acyltransferase, partial [Deltaproteobacteria bacterium]|nr:UDP-3-O-(3-hydroxymyristoyl)glucosamine N-acyltransferase [Deltaproteobacteria bacterium]
MPSLQDLARLIDARIIGDPQVEVHDLKTLDQAGPGDLAFL